MESVLFVVMLACLFLVVGWYVGNEMRGAKGDWGFLAVRGERRDRPAEDETTYRMKPPRAKGAGVVRPPSSAGSQGGKDAAPAYAAPDKARRFHEQDAALYRSRGPLPRFGERSAGRPEPQDGEQD